MVIQIVYSLFIEMCLSYKKYYSIFVFCLLLSYIQVHTGTPAQYYEKKCLKLIMREFISYFYYYLYCITDLSQILLE